MYKCGGQILICKNNFSKTKHLYSLFLLGDGSRKQTPLAQNRDETKIIIK
jgi:hypothetical protein